MSFVEFTGTARIDKRTKRLVKRLGPDDIAIIDHRDIDRVSSRGAPREPGARRLQRLSVGERTLPQFRAPRARAGRCAADRLPRRRALRGGGEGGGVARRSRGESLPQRDAARRRPQLDNRRARPALDDQRGRVTEALETFAENTLQHLRDEVEGPHRGRAAAAAADERDRHALVVARAPEAKPARRTALHSRVPADPDRRGRRRRQAARGRLHAAPDRRRHGSVSDEALRSGAGSWCACPNGEAPGRERVDRLGLPSAVMPRPV